MVSYDFRAVQSDTHVFVSGVFDRLMLRELGANGRIRVAFVDMQTAFAVSVRNQNRPNVLRMVTCGT